MSSEFTILVDMDGVLVNPHSKILRQVNEEFGTDYSVEDWIRWDYEWMERPEHGIFIHDNLWRQDDLYDDLEPVPGAVDFIESLEELGRVVLVSSPMIGHADSKLRWIEWHGFAREDRALVSDKSLVDGDLLLDDGPHNVKAVDYDAIIWDQPWNNDFLNGRHGVCRARTWDEVLILAEVILTRGAFRESAVRRPAC